NAMSGVPRLVTIQSTSSNSISLVIAQFSFGTDVKATTQAIDEAIAKANLPATASPTVQALNLNASPVVISSVASTGTGTLEGVGEIARLEIVPELEAIEGVARVDLTGGLEQQVFVTLDPKKMAAAGITSQQVVSILQANNLTLPSGQIATDGSKVPVSTIGTFTSEAQINDLVVGFTKPAPAAPGGPAASAAPGPPGRPCRIGGPGRLGGAEPCPGSARPHHHRRSRIGRHGSRGDHRLRPNQWRPGPDRHRLQAVEREYGRSGRPCAGQAGRDRQASQGSDDGHDRCRPVGVHQGIGRRPRPR